MVNLPIEYSDKPVTPFGGMTLMKRFVDQTGIRERLPTLEFPHGGSNRAFNPRHTIEGFWLGVWTEASRYIHCDWLRQDETLASIFGYECLPSQSTYSRFFGKFLQARNTAVFPPLQRWFFSQINIGVRKQISRSPQAAGKLLFEDLPDSRFSLYKPVTRDRCSARLQWRRRPQKRLFQRGPQRRGSDTCSDYFSWNS